MNARITIGLPKAMLYHEYHVLWEAFFKELGIRTITSSDTNRLTIKNGTELAIDENCFSTKIYFGHVKELIGKCDYIFVPRINNCGVQREMCMKFSALYDVCRNVFRSTGQQFLSCNIDTRHGIPEDTGYIKMAIQLGYDKKQAVQAYKKAKQQEAADKKKNALQQKNLLDQDGIKIVLAAHSYVIEDAYIGKPIMDYLESEHITPIRADLFDQKEILKKSLEISPTLKWELSRKIVGGIELSKKKTDGIILVSAFPCGPDSLVNEIIIRRFKDVPILNIVLDSQSGTAGLETRLESFVDIIRMRRKL